MTIEHPYLVCYNCDIYNIMRKQCRRRTSIGLLTLFIENSAHDL